MLTGASPSYQSNKSHTTAIEHVEEVASIGDGHTEQGAFIEGIEIVPAAALVSRRHGFSVRVLVYHVDSSASKLQERSKNIVRVVASSKDIQLAVRVCDIMWLTVDPI